MNAKTPPSIGQGQDGANQARLRALIQALGQDLVERETAARLLLLAALAGEHVLLLGPPGTAKSLLARRLHQVLAGEGGYFERLLTRFSVPEELFGPLSIQALEQDRYLRQTAGYLPEARIAFIDEVFKANSAILNTLLTLLNERLFDNGCERRPVPLQCLVGASNELPEEAELEALYDRFLIRYELRPVSEAGFERLLDLEERPFQPPERPLDEAVRQAILARAEGVRLGEAVRALLLALRAHLQARGIAVSDRRWRKVVRLLRVSAASHDRDEVDLWDAWLLQHCLWSRPEERAVIADWYREHLGLGVGFDAPRITRLVETWEATLAEERDSRVQRRDAHGAPLYRDRAGRLTTRQEERTPAQRDGEPLYLAPPEHGDRDNAGRGYTRAELAERFFDDLYQQRHIDGEWRHLDQYIADPANRYLEVHPNEPVMEPVRHPRHFLEARIRETEALARDLEAVAAALQHQREALASRVGGHLWIDPAFQAEARAALERATVRAETLARRMAAVAEGYRALPAAEDAAPAHGHP